MTPGILAAQRARVAFTVHEYEHDPAAESYGNEAVEKTGANPDQVFKTLVVSLDGKDLAVAVVPVSAMLSLKLIARAAGAVEVILEDGLQAAMSRFNGPSPSPPGPPGDPGRSDSSGAGDLN